MRINLVRAFLNSKIVVINSDLSCVDVKMRAKIVMGINYLMETYEYTVFCRTIEVIGTNYLKDVSYLNFSLKNQEKIKSENT